ncbi:TIGR03089 family protein [Actinoplanes sp. NPDC049265]|uniref:TIGR03089 family protein n=1 Tax=Actinoplanes sp. NPDC049265 TaxID=3363902 RepID=UPI00371B3AE9
MTETILAAFSDAVRRDAAAPLITYYDDRSGERVELSGATLDNWLSKTANLLVDGVGLGQGDTIAVMLPPHWQGAAIVLGAFAAGVSVDLGPEPQPVEAIFTSPSLAPRAEGWPTSERYVTGLLPFALALPTPPPGFVDYPTEVRTHGDHFRPIQPVTPNDAALAGPTELSHGDLVEAAADRARELGISTGDRVLVDAAAHPDPLDWLFAPLQRQATVVLCTNLDPAGVDHRMATEKCSLLLA